MTNDSFARRLLVALADATPAFTPDHVDGADRHGRRVLAALADATPAFSRSRTLTDPQVGLAGMLSASRLITWGASIASIIAFVIWWWNIRDPLTMRWVAVVVGLSAAALVLVLYWRRHAMARMRAPVLGLTLYLDPASRRTFGKDTEPVVAIRRFLDALERSGDIVHVDLFAHRVELAELRDLKAFIMVSGTFREIAKAEGTRTLVASYDIGEKADAGQPHVRMTVLTEGLSRPIPDGAFPGRCLGRVRHWDSGLRALVIEPIAIYQ